MEDASLYINWVSNVKSGTVTKLRQIIACQAARLRNFTWDLQVRLSGVCRPELFLILMLSRRNEAISQPHNYLLLELRCADCEWISGIWRPDDDLVRHCNS